ncbi:MAG: hypothetical protein MUO76_07220 [Anaerolineaceae bacterium]|nr:hypothetical protein [Anaerolineaceae bacterium]
MMDWDNVITIISILATIAVAINGIRWSNHYEKAKEERITLHKERIDILEKRNADLEKRDPVFLGRQLDEVTRRANLRVDELEEELLRINEEYEAVKTASETDKNKMKKLEESLVRTRNSLTKYKEIANNETDKKNLRLANELISDLYTRITAKYDVRLTGEMKLAGAVQAMKYNSQPQDLEGGEPEIPEPQ